MHVLWLWCLSSFVFNTSVPTHNGNGLGGSPSTWKWDRMAIKMDVGLLFLCVCVAAEVFVVVVLSGNLLGLSAEYVTFMSMANGDSVLRCFSSDGMPANRIHKLALSLNTR